MQNSLGAITGVFFFIMIFFGMIVHGSDENNIFSISLEGVTVDIGGLVLFIGNAITGEDEIFVVVLKE